MEASVLNGKIILAVDEQQEFLKTLEEKILSACPTCQIDKAATYKQAFELMAIYTYDLLLLNVAGFRAFDLLDQAILVKFPIVVVTGDGVLSQNLDQAFQKGARAFLPRNAMNEIVPLLEDVLRDARLSEWRRFLERIGSVFNEKLAFSSGKKRWERSFMKESIHLCHRKHSRSRWRRFLQKLETYFIVHSESDLEKKINIKWPEWKSLTDINGKSDVKV
jgi:CheY-like chemotaxis protein